MADAVDVKVVYDGPRKHVVHLQNYSDGTGEAAVIKVDISTLTNAKGATCTYTVVDRIEFNVFGMNVRLYWDHSTDDEIATLQGDGVFDWSESGGLVDPQSSGGTGDILLTTTGHALGDSYDITLFLRKK